MRRIPCEGSGQAVHPFPLGINPGGRIATWAFPVGSIDPKWHNRLLSGDEADSIPPVES